MKIKPFFKTKLSAPFQGKHYHEAGTPVMMASIVKTKSLGKFIITTPDPVSLNLNNADNFIQKSKLLKSEIDSEKNILILSNKFTPKDIAGMKQNGIIKLDGDNVFEFIQTTMGAVISMIAAIESFLNMAVPPDYKTEIIKNETTKIISRDQIVRRFSLEEKIELIAKIKNKNDIKQQKFWGSFKTIKNLRDDIIHFKKTDLSMSQTWSYIMVPLFDTNFDIIFRDFVNLINYLEPLYLEETET